MPPIIAAAVFTCVIAGLYWLDRERWGRVSVFLWLPAIWLALASSRSVGQWLAVGTNQGITSDQMMEGSPLDRLVYTGLLALGVGVLIARGSRVGKFLRGNWPILLFFVYCLVSLGWSDFPGVAFKRWTKAVGDFVMILIVLTERDPLLAIKKFFSRPAFLLVPLSVLFIKYYPQIGKGYSRWEGKALYCGVATNKNTLGVICLFFGLGALWRFLSAFREHAGWNRTRQLAAHGLILLMVLWLFYIANSMTALSCFAMASGLLFVSGFHFVARRPALLHCLVFFVIVVCVFIELLGASPALLRALGRNPTLTDRTEVWGVVLGMGTNPILGTGFESFWLGPRLDKIWSIYQWGPTEAHNGYIEVYLNLGWMGIFLLGVVLAAGYVTVIKAYRHKRAIGGLFVAFFAIGVIYNFTEAAFFRMMAPAWLFVLLAMTKTPLLSKAKGTHRAGAQGYRTYPAALPADAAKIGGVA